MIFAAGLLGIICGYCRFSARYCYFLQDEIYLFRLFHRFILLCGDVAQNPGPNSGELCGFCKAAVIDTDPAVCCDMCDTWVHVSCDPKILLSDYQILVTDFSDDLWVCTLCDTAADWFVTPRVSSEPSLSCICFKVRSILSKHFDQCSCIPMCKLF